MSKDQTTKRVLIILAALVLCWAPAGSGWAQEKPDCEDGAIAVGHLGILDFEAKIKMGVSRTGGETRPALRFLSEPRVGAVDPEGPSQGKFKVGDVIVAINGHLITTQEAGDLFLDPPVDEPIDFTIRRDGAQMKVTVVPTWICADDPRALLPYRLIYRVEERMRLKIPPEAADDTGDLTPVPRPEPMGAEAPPRPERPERPALPIPGLPHPWMGFGLECSIDGNWTSDDLRFTKPPMVFRVESDSKAKEAGLRRRDMITHIDGVRIDTLEGTERFTRITPGQRIEWTVLRDGKPLTLKMQAEPVPRWAERLAAAPKASTAPEPMDEELRYAGVLGETAIEVRGGTPVNVTVDEERGEVVIRTPDTIIRLKKTTKHDEKK